MNRLNQIAPKTTKKFGLRFGEFEGGENCCWRAASHSYRRRCFFFYWLPDTNDHCPQWQFFLSNSILSFFHVMEMCGESGLKTRHRRHRLSNETRECRPQHFVFDFLSSMWMYLELCLGVLLSITSLEFSRFSLLCTELRQVKVKSTNLGIVYMLGLANKHLLCFLIAFSRNLFCWNSDCLEAQKWPTILLSSIYILRFSILTHWTVVKTNRSECWLAEGLRSDNSFVFVILSILCSWPICGQIIFEHFHLIHFMPQLSVSFEVKRSLSLIMRLPHDVVVRHFQAELSMMNQF